MALLLGARSAWGHRARQRRFAASEIEELCGRVWWDVRTSAPDAAVAPEWLTSKFPPEYFGVLTSVCLPQATDRKLKLLLEFRQLRSLHLSHGQITDEGMRTIAELRALTRLTSYGSEVTDDGMIHLGELVQPKYLTLQSSQIQGRGLRHLAALPNLDSAALESPVITDEGFQRLEALRGLPELKGVIVYGSRVTEAGLRRFTPILSNCSVSLYPPPNSVRPATGGADGEQS
ncbi:MAG: hypothetical protein AAF961_04670 [Planctomycetota bacterium]